MSRVFKGFNDQSRYVCPICETNENKEAVLFPIDGTEEEDNICEAIQVHHDCLLDHLRYSKDLKFIYVKCPVKKIDYKINHGKT